MPLAPPVGGFDPVADFVVETAPMAIGDGPQSMVKVDGSLRYEWSPSPRLMVDAEARSAGGIFFEPAELDAPSLRLRAPCWLAQQTRTRDGMTYRGWLKDPTHAGDIEQLLEIRCVLVNFTALVPITVTVGEWDLELEPVPDLDGVLRSTMKARAHAGTHLARLRRSDGASFSPDAADELRDVLYWAFAFAAGHHVGVALTTGFDASGRPVWRDWRETIVDRSAPRLSWFEPRDPSGFGKLVAVLHEAWQELGASIPTALSFYLQANTTSSSGTALVIGSAALELVSWLALVEGGPRLTREGFDRLFPSDRIRLMLRMANATPKIPSEFSQLAAYATANSWRDGPHAVTELRNSVVHPKSRAKVLNAPGDAQLGAIRLLLWYFDLLLLNLLRYDGGYIPHTVAGPTAARRAAFGLVPWATQ